VVALPVLAADKREGESATTDYEDFLLLADARPVLVRLHVRVGDRPARAAWDEFMASLFKYLDVDGDGALDKGELERAPSADLLLGRGPQGLGPAGRMRVAGPIAANKDGKVTPAELADYYRKNGLTPVQLQIGPTPISIAQMMGRQDFMGRGPARRSEPRPGGAVARATFALLDAGKDGKLTREKLAAAPAALLKADWNDDEIVTAEELAASFAGRQPTRAQADPVMLLGADEPAAEVVRRLQQRYGPAAARFERRSPDLELTVRLGANTPDGPGVELTDRAGSPPLAAKARAAGGAISFDLDTLAVHVSPGADEIRPHGLERMLRSDDLFDRMDPGRKGYVDEAQMRGFGMIAEHFNMMDRDGDGKVSQKEFLAYFREMSALQARATAACVSLVFIDEGRGLFDLLDTNRDGRLSVREMRQAPRLLDRLDRDGKGYVTAGDVPRTWHLLVRRGPAGGAGLSNFGGGAGVQFVRPAPAPKAAGPLWFRLMDRNGDGDVSRREFPGSDELFQKIDTDGDGLISAEEATRADALVRKEK
jgi:Ca2+-binding EF-hand superfamily protein